MFERGPLRLEGRKDLGDVQEELEEAHNTKETPPLKLKGKIAKLEGNYINKDNPLDRGPRTAGGAQERKVPVLQCLLPPDYKHP